MSFTVHYHFPCGHTDSEVYESSECGQQAKEQDVVMDESCIECKVAEMQQAEDECCELALEEWEMEVEGEGAWDV